MGWTMDGEEDSGLPPCQAAAKEPEGIFYIGSRRGGRSGQPIRNDILLSGDICRMSTVCSAR